MPTPATPFTVVVTGESDAPIALAIGYPARPVGFSIEDAEALAKELLVAAKTVRRAAREG